jgi:phosphopantothenoylcysteine decarboxylase/phosphopantothenate--cysteine ligase
MSLIALGVTGGIGAYKAVEVARGLQQAGHDVAVVMTEAATRFVGPLTFEAITRRRVITGQFEPGANADIEHIALASSIGLLLVAPATANIIGKFSAGVADDFLSSLYLATKAPVLLAPAMNTNMWEHAAVRRNLDVLTARGVGIVEPGEGFLACGWTGKGRLAEPEAIVAAAERVLRPVQTLVGARVVVSAGPTCEDIDPVRYVGNRSSGRMGFAVAAEAAGRGASVVVVAGPTTVEPPAGVEVVRVRSAAQMHAAMLEHAADADIVVMAAAVADYAPVRAAQKITKESDELVLRLARTPDILSDLGARRASGALRASVLVGFAAETTDVLAHAREKRRRKQVDLIVANDVSRADRGFDVESNAVTIVAADDEIEVPLQPKAGVARAIVDRIVVMLQRGREPRGVEAGL